MTTTNYHTPLSAADLLTLLVSLNGRFSDLDSGITGLLQTLGGEIEAEAGEGLGDRDTAYLDLDDGKVYLMDADASTPKAGLIRGFVSGTVSMGATATLVITGLLDGFTGLTAGQPVYVGTTAGSYTQTRPVPSLGGSQVAIIEMGFTLTTEVVFIHPQPIVYELRDAMAQNDTLTINHHKDERGYIRNPRAYITESGAGAALASYADSNQDAYASLQGGDGAGGTTTPTGSGTTTRALGDAAGDEYRLAQSFQVTGGILSQIIVNFGANTGSPSGDVTWGIAADNTGIPGTVLQSGTFTPTASQDNTIPVANGIFLAASTTYWLTLEATAQATNQSYNVNFNTGNPYANGRARQDQNAAGTWAFAEAILAGYDMRCSLTTVAVDFGQQLAQGFQIASAGNAPTVRLWLKKVGTPSDNLTVEIHPDSTTDPSGTPVTNGTSDTVAASSLSTSFGWIEFPFSTAPNLSGSTQYHLVLKTTGSQSDINFVVWGTDASSPSYSDGQLKSFNGTTWDAEGDDACFEVLAPGTTHPSKVNVDWWSSTLADMVNRYGDGAGASLETQTTFKCIRSAGFDDVSVQVVMP